MKNIKLIIFLALSVGLLSACVVVSSDTVRGDGNVVEETRQVEGVRGVELATIGDLTVEFGDTEGLVVEAEENLLPYIETRVRGGVLVIEQTLGSNIQSTRSIRYTLTVSSLESLTVTSSGNIRAPAVEADRCELSIRSSGNIDLDAVTCDRLDVEISSSGNIRIGSGDVNEQTISIRSSGAYDGGDIRSQTAKVEVSSSGNATIWVEEQLDARISSSGNVYYYGRPEVSERNTSSGEVVSRGDK